MLFKFDGFHIYSIGLLERSLRGIKLEGLELLEKEF
jgi:hypothetical protein